MTDQHNLELLIDSHFPIAVLETHEEQRAVDLIKSIYGKKNKGLQIWTVVEGLKNHLITDLDMITIFI